jgi:hypothetical protein
MPGLDPGIHRNKAAGESPPFLFSVHGLRLELVLDVQLTIELQESGSLQTIAEYVQEALKYLLRFNGGPNGAKERALFLGNCRKLSAQ